MQSLLKKHYHHLVAILTFTLVSVIYFYPQLQGKTISGSDVIQYNAAAKQLKDYEKETGKVALWTGAMFGGMPTFQISGPIKNNLLSHVEKLLNLGFKRPIGYFIMGMISFYIMLLAFGVSPWLSILGALLFSFATGNVILFDTGHATKLRTIYLSPPIIAGLVLMFKDRKWIGFLLFSIFLGMSIRANHPQMTYYLAMILFPLFIVLSVKKIQEKEYKKLLVYCVFLFIGTILAVGSSLSKIWTTYEYSKSTMRGKPILELEANQQANSSNTDGLAWDYAMNWSNGSIDVLQSFIPMSVGGSSEEILNDDSPLIKRIPQYKNQPLPLYWGDLTSTSGPYYFGAVVFFLFCFGGFAVKGSFKWWLVFAFVFTFLISMGKNFEILNRLLFDYLPLYNKFRTPNSVLAVTGIIMPILAILGIRELTTVKDKTVLLKPLYYSGGALVFICLILGLFGGSMFDFNGNYDSAVGDLVGLLKETRKEYLQSSSLRSAGLILVSALAMWAYIKGKLNKNTLIISVGLIAFLDLMVVNSKYLNSGDFQTKRSLDQNYTLTSTDQQILADPDMHYRVFDVQNFRNALPSYHHKTIGGYHPAKLQRYEDLINRHISQNNQQVLNMLNTKYIRFADGNNQERVQLNQGALGNAWLVNTVEIVENANQEIDALNRIDVSNTAAVHQEFNDYLTSTSFSGNGNVQLTNYSSNDLIYSFNSTEQQMVVFSEIWYQPGWKAYIDGQETDHIRVNYALRGLLVPAGNHEIVFKFEPRSYYLGETISLISSLLIMLSLFSVIGFNYIPGLREKFIKP